MPIFKNDNSADSAPKFVTDAATGETGIQEYGSELFYVDGTEGYPVAPGWARRLVRGSRILWESVAAIGSPVVDPVVARLAHRLYGPGYNTGAAPPTGDGAAKTYTASFVNESGAEITDFSVVFQGWTLRTTGTTDTGNSFTVTGTVEYPVGGTTTNIGSVVVTSGDAVESATLTAATPIPAGATFRVNFSSTVPNGAKYIGNLGFAGVRVHTRLSQVRKLALYAMGDSIMTNNNGAAYNAANSRCPVYHASISGTTARAYGESEAGFARQAQLAAKLGITHFLSNYGTNDFGASATVEALQGYLQTMKSMANAVGVKFVQTTMLPRTLATGAVSATLTSEGNTITATVPDATMFTVGNPYIIAGATQTEYNGNRRCASVNTANNTVTFIFQGSATPTATGTITINIWKQTFQHEWMSDFSHHFAPGAASSRGVFNAWVRGGAFDSFIDWADACESARDSGRWAVSGSDPLLPAPEVVNVTSVINSTRFNSAYSGGSNTMANGFVAALTGPNIGLHRQGNGNTNGDITVTAAWTATQVVGNSYYVVPGVSYMSDDGTHPRVSSGNKGGQVHLDNVTIDWITANA